MTLTESPIAAPLLEQFPDRFTDEDHAAFNDGISPGYSLLAVGVFTDAFSVSLYNASTERAVRGEGSSFAAALAAAEAQIAG